MSATQGPGVLHDYISLLPKGLHSKAGAVFYTGWRALAGPADAYILGLNPGADPASYTGSTIGWSLERTSRAELFSAYLDEAWGDRPIGKTPFQRRIQHLAALLGLDLRRTPASNLAFARSARWGSLSAEEREAWLDISWPVHARVIERLRPRAVLCLSAEAGTEVCARLGKGPLLGVPWRESNARKWRCWARRTAAGPAVLALTHPSIANWAAPATDPGPWARDILATTLRALP